MIKVAVLTATRAEYGLMRQLLFKLRDDPDIELSLLVTGTHLSEDYGMTVNEIIDDNIHIVARIDILSQKDGEIDVSRTMAKAIVEFSDFFQKNRFDILFVDGDRYETLAVCVAAINNNIPVAHCGGGATTEGAYDEYWRHAITKLSYIHFPTMEIYRRRIIRMGEDPNRVCVSGSPGLENIRLMRLGGLSEVEERVGISLDSPYALVTFHPIVCDDEEVFIDQVRELFDACINVSDMKYIFTMANADRGGGHKNKMLVEYCESNKDRFACVQSLGTYLYLTAMKHCEFVMGNSSSGLIEAPSFGIPTINIGDRQKGREKAKSVIDCQPVASDIIHAIEKARDIDFREECKNVVNPNGDGHASEIIIEKIKEMYKEGKLSMEKSFYDVE